MKTETSSDSGTAGTSRKHYSREFKQRLVRQSLAPGASAAKIALKHQINANLLFKWRQQYLREIAGPAAEPLKLLPVTVRESTEELRQPAQATQLPRPSRSGPCGTLEIVLPQGRIVAKGDVSIELLRSAVQIVRSR